MTIVNLNEDNFKAEIIDFKGTAIVDFFADWCGPCKVMGPIFDEAAKKVGDGAKFGKLNVDGANKIAAEFGVMSIPTLIIFKDGIKVEQMAGVQDMDSLIKKVKEV